MPPQPDGESVPFEVYLMIITPTLLPNSDLVTLLRVSRSIHFITAPIIFPLLYTNLDIDLSLAFNPLAINGIPIPLPPKPYSVTYEIVFGDTLDSSGLPTITHRITSLIPLPNRFEHIIHLTLTQHNSTHCSLLLPLELPNLVSLRIRPNGSDHHLNLCRGHTSENTCCPPISKLRPKTLIVGGLPTGLTGKLAGLWHLLGLSSGPPSVKHLVVLVGIFAGYEQGPEASVDLLPGLGGLLDKVSFVVSCGQKGRRYAQRRKMIIKDVFERWEYLTVALRSVVKVVKGEAQDMEIVGIESMISDRCSIGMLEEFIDRESDLDYYGDNEEKEDDGVEKEWIETMAVFTADEDFTKREGWFKAQQSEMESEIALLRKVLEVARARNKGTPVLPQPTQRKRRRQRD